MGSRIRPSKISKIGSEYSALSIKTEEQNEANERKDKSLNGNLITNEEDTLATSGKKRVWVAYLLWFFFGWYGIHHLYLRRDRQAFLWFALFGGYFGLGWFRDLWCIPTYVRDTNNDPEFLRKLKKKKAEHPEKPPFNWLQFICEVLVGNTFAWLCTAAVPQEPVYGFDLTWLTHLSPLATAIGVHTVGNVGRQQGEIKWLLLTAYSSYISSFFINLSLLGSVSVLCASTFEKKLKRWRTKVVHRRTSVRLIIFTTCAVFYLSLFASYLYFNAEVTDSNGEVVKFRTAVNHFFEGPMWKELVAELHQLYNYVKANGMYKVWEELIHRMDLQGEKTALKVLGLPSSATQEEITAQYRKLSRQWHPDKHKDAKDKAIAQEKFMQIQQAYERLSNLKGRRQQKSRSDL